MGGKNIHVLVHFQDDVAVALTQEPGGLLRLDLVGDDAIFRGVDEIVQIGGSRAAVLLGKIGLSGLDGRRKLHLIHISRLDLRLHQVVHLPAEAAAEDSEVADLILQNDGLGKDRFPVAHYPQPRDLEKAAGRVADPPGGGVIVPGFAPVQGGLAYGDMNIFVSLLNPKQ